MSLVDQVRRPLQAGLQAKVAGPGGRAAARRIWETPGPRWFTPTDPIWRVHADAAMFVGGVRALTLQSLHPRAMAGVAEHSGYRDDPWARVASTATYLATTTYGTVDHAHEAIAAVRRIHDRVHGTTADGLVYDAADPELLGWVHAAEIDSFLTAFQTFSGHPLPRSDADTYVAQAGISARLLGLPDPPETVAALRASLERYRPDLAMTAPAADAIGLVLHEPPLAWYGRPLYDRVAAAAVATLPPWARELIRTELALPSTRWALPLGRATLAAVAWVMGSPERRQGDAGATAER